MAASLISSSPFYLHLLRFPKEMQSLQIMLNGISLSLVLINLVAIMERADENLLPAAYKEVSEALDIGPTKLGYLTFIRNLVQALSSPLAGILTLHHNRPTVLAIGTACWALATAGVGVSRHFVHVASWRALNGFGLAIVIPALQSFIADSYKDGSRGMGFGLLNFVGSIGGMAGGALATIMAGQEYGRIPGWRLAFVMTATLSLLIGILVYLFVVDPRKGSSVANLDAADDDPERVILVGSVPQPSVWQDSWLAMISVLKVPTFRIIVLQGIVGSLPWTAMVFFTMWYELIGFDHNRTAILSSLFAIGGAIGAFIGGSIADRMSKFYPNSGRIVCAQFSAFMGMPLSWILLAVIPPSVDSWYAFAATSFIMGLTITWCTSCANNPIFALVAPPKHRTMIYAFDRALEGSFSSLAAPAVGVLTEKIFGYDRKSLQSGSGSAQAASALSRGLLLMTVIPYGLSCLLYTPLYFTFHKDRYNS